MGAALRPAAQLRRRQMRCDLRAARWGTAATRLIPDAVVGFCPI